MSDAMTAAVSMTDDPQLKRRILEYMTQKGLRVTDITPSSGPPNIIVAYVGQRRAFIRCDQRRMAGSAEPFRLSLFADSEVELTPEILESELR